MNESNQKAPSSPARVGGVLFIVSVAICIGVGVLVPLSTPRITLHHYRAARSVRDVVNAEIAFSSRFPAVGYTCDMHAFEKTAESQDQIPTIDAVLASGEKSEYRFALSDCQPGSKAIHYVISAVPKVRGTDGNYTFCANESGIVWFDDGSSSTACLAERRPWKE